MLRFRPIFAAAALAALSGATSLGCAVIADPGVMLADTQRRYTQLMRYTDFEHAGHYVAPDDRAGFRERTAALGDLRFTDYEVLDVENLGSTAKAQVRYVGYRASAPVVVTFLEDQQWEREGSTWLVRSHLSERTP